MPSLLIYAVTVQPDGMIRSLNYSPQYAALSSIVGSHQLVPYPLIERFEQKRLTSFTRVQPANDDTIELSGLRINPLAEKITGRRVFGNLVIVKERENPFSVADLDELVGFLYGGVDFYSPEPLAPREHHAETNASC